ncbi:hypothetical protein [Sinomonas atrocyanea]
MDASETEETGSAADGAVDPALLINLLRLRLLLHQGVQTAQTSADLRRTTAVVLLDAAVERSLHMVATDAGLTGKRDELESLISKVAQHLGASWERVGLASVRQLHRARNSVQHEGLGADRAELDGWVTAVSQFVPRLIKAQYDLDLNRLSLASAIADSEIRGYFREAEAARDEERIEACFRWLQSLFTLVSQKWEMYIDKSLLRPGLRPYEVIDPQAMAYLESEVAALRSLALISPLTTDIAEVAWFLRASQVSQYLDEADAERALSVVFWLVVAFEASPAADSESDRRHAWMKKHRLTRSGAGPAYMSAYTFRQRAVGPPTLLIRLGGVPEDDDDFMLWLDTLRRLLAQNPSIREHGTYLHVDESGLVVFSPSPQGEVNLRTMLETLGPALTTAENDFLLQRSVIVEERANVRGWAERVRHELEEQSYPEWVDRVDVDYGQGQASAVAVVHLAQSARGAAQDLLTSIRSHPEITDARQVVTQDSTMLRLRPVRAELLAEVLNAASDIVSSRIAVLEQFLAKTATQEDEVRQLLRQYNVPENPQLE